MTDYDDADGSRTYQIGTVSSLTGIDSHTIRAWERRYGAIKPMRSESGRRLYSDDTVERLQLLKGLVDCNEAISTIADLSDEQLRKRLEKLAEHEVHSARRGATAEDPERRATVAVCAPSIEVQIAASEVSLSDFEIVLREPDPQQLLEGLRREPCEIVLLELENLTGSVPGTVQACLNTPGDPQVVMLYRFASRGDLARIARAGATLVRSPIRLESLRRVILDRAMIGRARNHRLPRPTSLPAHTPAMDEADARSNPSERRLDDEQLARLLEVTTAVECECPNHLSSLITGLVAFETYSRECESRDEADAAQHRRLAEGTAEARGRMEELLIELCEHEGISI